MVVFLPLDAFVQLIRNHINSYKSTKVQINESISPRIRDVACIQNRNFDNMTIDEKIKTTPAECNDTINNPFIPLRIQSIIETSNSTLYEFNVTIHGVNINTSLHIYEYSDKLRINEIIRNIILTLHVAVFLIYKLRVDLDIVIYYIHEKKIITPKSYPINIISVNSGFTINNSTSRKKIVIFRSEELYKVIIHEIIHAFEIEKPLYSMIDKLNDTIRGVVDFKPNHFHDRPAEHYVEYLAELVYFAMISVVHKRNIRLIIRDEINHVTKIVGKVFRMNSDKNKKKFNQEANFINYYFVRGGMLLKAYEENKVMFLIRNKFDQTKYASHIKNAMINPAYTQAIAGSMLRPLDAAISSRMVITDL